MPGRNFHALFQYRQIECFIVKRLRQGTHFPVGTYSVEDNTLYCPQKQNIQTGVSVIVDYNMLHLRNLLHTNITGDRDNFRLILALYKEESFYLRIGAEQLLAKRLGGTEQQPDNGDHRYPDITGWLYFNQHYGSQYQHHGG